MSRYSGKCDFRDCLEINFNDDWEDFNSRATVYHNKKKLRFNQPADLIPWYTYIISSAGFQRKGPCTIHLSENNYLDEQISEYERYNQSTEYLKKKKEEILLLYAAEVGKPIEEQKII